MRAFEYWAFPLRESGLLNGAVTPRLRPAGSHRSSCGRARAPHNSFNRLTTASPTAAALAGFWPVISFPSSTTCEWNAIQALP